MNRNFVLVVVACVLFACSTTVDYSQIVLDFQRHKNDGDLESVMLLFADDPTLNFGSLGTISGLTGVRRILEYDIALKTHLQFHDCQAHELTVSCRVVESNDWLRTVDIESITYDENRFDFTAEGRIQSVSATLSAESAQSLGTAMTEFHSWATTHRPMEYEVLFSDDGNFVYSQENAERVLALLRIWRNK